MCWPTPAASIVALLELQSLAAPAPKQYCLVPRRLSREKIVSWCHVPHRKCVSHGLGYSPPPISSATERLSHHNHDGVVHEAKAQEGDGACERHCSQLPHGWLMNRVLHSIHGRRKLTLGLLSNLTAQGRRINGHKDTRR